MKIAWKNIAENSDNGFEKLKLDFSLKKCGKISFQKKKNTICSLKSNFRPFNEIFSQIFSFSAKIFKKIIYCEDFCAENDNKNSIFRWKYIFFPKKSKIKMKKKGFLRFFFDNLNKKFSAARLFIKLRPFFARQFWKTDWNSVKLKKLNFGVNLSKNYGKKLVWTEKSQKPVNFSFKNWKFHLFSDRKM